ncbi:hypothetical protein [Halovivax sp.]|nr:hypothetical protein [Halovivax sp.]
MIEFTALPPIVQAALLVVLVSVEAIVLYVGYGVVEQALAPSVIETIETA